MMGFHFLPRDRQFWLLHLGATAFTVSVTLLTVMLWSPLREQDGAAALAWAPPFTLAMLGFRWMYRRYALQRWSMGRLIVAAVSYASVAAVFVTICVTAMTLPIFWNDLKSFYAARSMPLVATDYLLRSIASASLQAQVFLCAWIFIYISITGQRDARDREVANARLEASLKDAQLRSLANQLNPHFLFNSLNDIRFMMYENAAQADAMLVGLSDILRYSLEGALREKVPLAEELAVIERYVGIVSVQLESRLRFSIDAPVQLRSFLVPPLMLQMLVENAIKHGAASMQQGGAVHVSISARGPNLRLTVVNEKPTAACARGDSGPGLGLAIRNIEQRLHLLYGSAARHTSSSMGRQYEVTLDIPKEEA